MKLPQNSAAPALGRGLEILRILSREAPLSLEQLTARLGYPKPSVFRLLATLQNLDLIRRHPDKRYEPLWTLRPLFSSADARRRHLLDSLSALASELQSTIEWYEPSAAGMVLMRQEVPDAELRVQARPGFLRLWNGEADAVMLVGRAFYPDAQPLPDRLPAYVANGKWGWAPRTRVEAQVKAAARAGVAVDAFFNVNSVRRVAAAVTADGSLLGVLSVAVIYRFHKKFDGPSLSAFLKTLIKKLP